MINSFPSIKRRLKPKQSPDAHDQATVQTGSFELKRNDKYYAWLFLGPSILALRTCLDTLTFDLILVKLDQKQEFLIHEKLCTPL